MDIIAPGVSNVNSLEKRRACFVISFIKWRLLKAVSYLHEKKSHFAAIEPILSRRSQDSVSRHAHIAVRVISVFNSIR